MLFKVANKSRKREWKMWRLFAIRRKAQRLSEHLLEPYPWGYNSLQSTNNTEYRRLSRYLIRLDRIINGKSPFKMRQGHIHEISNHYFGLR